MKRNCRCLLALLLAAMLTLPLLAYAEEPVTFESESLTWKQDTSPVNYTLFFNLSWSPVDVWGTDAVSQQITADTGVSFDVIMAQDANHLANIIATGEYPDAVFVYGSKNLQLMEDPDISYAWNDLIDQYAPEMWDLIDPSDIALATKDDGNFYTLYTHIRNQEYWDDDTQGVSYGETVLAFNSDMMEELGNPEINSTDDLFNVLTQAKEKWPDCIPLLQPKTNGIYLSVTFGVNGEGFASGDSTVVDGKAMYYLSDREAVEGYLTYMNKLQRAGLISQEGLTYDFEQEKAAILGGNVFCFVSQAYDVDQINTALAEIEGDDRYYQAIDHYLTVDGEMLANEINGVAGFAGFYITKACENPGRLIALMEYMRSPYADKLTQWGIEGVHYTMVDGYPVQDPSISWKERGDNIWYFQATFAVENAKAMGTAITNPLSQVADLVLKYKKYWTNDTALTMITPADTGTELGDIKSAVSAMKDAAMMECIMADSEESCKALIDAMYQNMEDIGIEKYNAYLDEQYQKNKEILSAVTQE